MSGATIKTTIAALLAAAMMSAGALADPGPGHGPHHSAPPATKDAKPSPTSPAAPSGTQAVQGVVQSETAAVVVVRQLDGTTVNVPYDKKTQFFIDGKKAGADEVRSGYVLVASWSAGKPATTLRFLRPS